MRAASFVGFVLTAFAVSLNAQTWNGQGANDSWSNGQNWVGGIAPVSSSSTYVHIAGSTRLTPVADVDYVLNRLDFDPNAGMNGPPSAFVVSGHTLTFDGSAPQINNFSTRTEEVDNPIVIGANGLQIGGVSNFILGSTISGSGGVTITTGNGVSFVPSGPNTYSGLTTIASNAELSTGSNVIAIPGDLSIATGGIASLSTNSIASTSSVSIDGSGRIILYNGGQNSIGSLTSTSSSAQVYIPTNGNLTIGPGNSTYAGQLYGYGHLTKQGAPLVLSGEVIGGGTVTGPVTLGSGSVLNPRSEFGGPATTATLTFNGNLSLMNGVAANLKLGQTTGNDLIRITSGTFTGSGTNGFTINIANSGDFGQGTYTLIDWNGATASGVETSDFQLGTVVSGFDYNLFISQSELQLNVVPEPSIVALLGSACVLCFWFRQRLR